MTVYFIRDGEEGLVKIGHTRQFFNRLQCIRRLCASKPIVLRKIGGHIETEKWLHSYFSTNRVEGEWFEFNPEMMTINPPALENHEKDCTVRVLRFPTTLWAWLQKAAIQNGRTVRGEIVYRLEKSKDTVK